MPTSMQLLPKIEAIAYTRKRQAKQPCLDSEGEPQKATDVVPQYGWMTCTCIGLGD